MSLSRDRRAASTLLLRQFREQGRLDLWMRDVTADLPSAERRRVWSLVYGINRNRTLLSCHLEPLLKRPLSGQDPEIQVALLLGSYELLWQDSVPDRAAVDQAVKLARHLGQHGKRRRSKQSEGQERMKA